MANGAGDIWGLMTIVGVIVIGGVIAYGMMRSRKMTRGEKQVSERGTENLYDQEARDPANRGA